MANRQWTHDELKGILELGSIADLEKLIAHPGRSKYREHYAHTYAIDALKNVADSDVLPEDIRALVQRVLELHEKASDPFLGMDLPTEKEGDISVQSTQEYALYWHPSEMYTARLAYGNDIPLWGSERLEVFHDGRWVDGKVGHVGAASGLVLWPREKGGNPEYIVLTIGSLVRTVSEPVGGGTGPEAFNREQAIKQFTELSRRMRTNAYAEREPDSSYAEREPDGSYGADGIDESIDNIINAVAREGLAFVYQEEGDTYTLEPVPREADEPPADEEDGPELRQCPYCYELHAIEHIELCLLNPNRV